MKALGDEGEYMLDNELEALPSPLWPRLAPKPLEPKALNGFAPDELPKALANEAGEKVAGAKLAMGVAPEALRADMAPIGLEKDDIPG